jgi:hypothetical protein
MPVENRASVARKISELTEQVERIHAQTKQSIATMSGGALQTSRKLIISTGDISDVDGFYALAKYAQSGADVLFIMNYPAYLDQSMQERSGKKEENGCGFNFSKGQYFAASDEIMRFFTANSMNEKYSRLRTKYKTEADDGIHRIFTDLGFILSSNVWKDTHVCRGLTKGNLYFCIGGVNTISPFSAKDMKNELFVYVDYLDNTEINFGSYEETKTYASDKSEKDLNALLSQSDEIYIDFNGSMAFYHDKMKTSILTHGDRIKGAFVMGGVYSFEEPKTMPKIDGTLNRFSCATMNQLYSPEKAYDFFIDMAKLSIPIFMVANNEVHALETSKEVMQPGQSDRSVNTTIRTDFGWRSFLNTNGIYSFFLDTLADTYYNNPVYAPPRKAFDFYTALALTESMKRVSFRTEDKKLYFDKKYGICMIADPNKKWSQAVSDYFAKAVMTETPGDSDFIKRKKRNFSAEKATLSVYPDTSSGLVKIIRFSIDTKTYKLSTQS